MTITIELTPELETKISRNAVQNGLPMQDYIRKLLENAPIEWGLQATLPPEEFAKVLREWSESQPKNLPHLTDEDISRESIYGDSH